MTRICRSVAPSVSRSRTSTNLGPLAEALADRLRPHGYVRRGRAYVRRGLEADVVIGLQAGAFGVPPAPFVTVNLAVHVHAIDRWTGRRSTISATGENGHWRARLGTLIGGQDRWWCLDELPAWALDQHLAPVFGHPATELEGDIINNALPALARVSEPRELLGDWLAMLPTLDNDMVQFAAVIALERHDASAEDRLRPSLLATFPDPRWPALRNRLVDALGPP